jgi:hypothetical protein
MTDTLPSNVPKLDVSGANWAIWSLRFFVAIDAKGKWGHFDRTQPRLIPPLSTPFPLLMQTALAKVYQWDDDEHVSRYLLTQRIPDSTVMHLRGLLTVHAMWEAISREYSVKGAYAQTDLHTQFIESKCPEGGDVRVFLQDLRTKREELAAIGVIVDEKDYRSTVLSSLPNSLSNFASNVIAAARLTSGYNSINLDALIQMISKEYDRQQMKKCRNNAAKASKGKDKDNKAMSATQGKGKKKFPPGSCYNCGEKGHYKNKCPKLAKDKGKSKAEAGTASAAAEESDSEAEGVFCYFELSDFEGEDNHPEVDLLDVLVFEETQDREQGAIAPGVHFDNDMDMWEDSDSLPDLQSVSDTDDEAEYSDSEAGDWDSLSAGEEEAMDEGDFLDYESEIDGISQWSFGNDSFLADSEPEIYGISQLSCDDLDSNIVLSVTSDMKIDGHTELYDSGAGRHISPYRNNFINFISIPPKPFRAANKGTFYATGKGDLDVLVPNGSDWSTL